MSLENCRCLSLEIYWCIIMDSICLCKHVSFQSVQELMQNMLAVLKQSNDGVFTIFDFLSIDPILQVADCSAPSIPFDFHFNSNASEPPSIDFIVANHLTHMCHDRLVNYYIYNTKMTLKYKNEYIYIYINDYNK